MHESAIPKFEKTPISEFDESHDLSILFVGSSKTVNQSTDRKQTDGVPPPAAAAAATVTKLTNSTNILDMYSD